MSTSKTKRLMTKEECIDWKNKVWWKGWEVSSTQFGLIEFRNNFSFTCAIETYRRRPERSNVPWEKFEVDCE